MVNKKHYDITVVIGANYGDEGKGRMTDYFANKAIKDGKKTIVVCSNGGAQRGHTVRLDNGYNHMFHHIGSGTLAGADTYLPQSFIVNPMLFMKEMRELYKDLDKTGLKNLPKIFVHPDCLISTPFDMMNNQIIEDARGDKKHGSVGAGIWETIFRNGASMFEMSQMSNENLFNYLKWVRDKYSTKRHFEKGYLPQMDEALESWEKIFFNDNMIHNYILDFRKMEDLITYSNDYKLMDYDSIIFENGQGLCISQDMGDIYTTPSYTGITEPKKIIDKVFKENKLDYDVEACYVSRTYLTRHGMGYLENEYYETPEFVRLDTESNIESKYQGKFRYGNIKDIYLPVTLGDMDLVKYNTADYKMSVAYTHCDEYFPGIVTGLNTKTYYVFGPRRGDAVDEFKGINKDITEQ